MNDRCDRQANPDGMENEAPNFVFCNFQEARGLSMLPLGGTGRILLPPARELGMFPCAFRLVSYHAVCMRRYRSSSKRDHFETKPFIYTLSPFRSVHSLLLLMASEQSEQQTVSTPSQATAKVTSLTRRIHGWTWQAVSPFLSNCCWRF